MRFTANGLAKSKARRLAARLGRDATRRLRMLLGVTLVLVAPANAGAKETSGFATVATIVTDTGFVDDAYAFDGGGSRLAYINSDAAKLSTIHVTDVIQGREIAQIDISKVTTSPIRVAFVLDGETLLVTAATRAAADAPRIAFVVNFAGKVLRRFGPAADVTLAEVDGAPAVVSFTKKTNKTGTTYQISAQRLSDGKRVGKAQTLSADAEGLIPSLGMIVLYWLDGHTTLVARKKGGYDQFKDRRMPDSEARYAVLEGNILQTREPTDVIAYTKVLKLRETRDDQPSFVLVSENHAQLERIADDDTRAQITLAEPMFHYEPASLQQERYPDGRVYFSLTIDPVNPDAVARKKADPELIDFYVLAPDSTTAKRLGRVAKAKRSFSWRAAGPYVALLRKHVGFARGGDKLEVYRADEL